MSSIVSASRCYRDDCNAIMTSCDRRTFRPMPNNQEMFLGEEAIADAVLFEVVEITEPLPIVLPEGEEEMSYVLDMGVLQYVVDQAQGNETLAEGKPDEHPATSLFPGEYRLIKGVSVASSIRSATDEALLAEADDPAKAAQTSVASAPASVASKVVIMSAALLPASVAAASGFPSDPAVTRAVACGFQHIALGDSEGEPSMDVALCVAALRVPALATDVVVCVNCPTEQARAASDASSGAKPAASDDVSVGDDTTADGGISSSGEGPAGVGSDAKRRAGLQAAMARARAIAISALQSLELVDVKLFG